MPKSSKITRFQMTYDKPGFTYFPGETITGLLHLELSEPMKTRGIKVKIKGECKVHWTESRSTTDSNGRSKNETVHYDGNEEYFNASYYVLGNKDAVPIELSPGSYSYPFNFVLPPNIPCTFEHSIGRVRYTLKATIDRPWKFDYDALTVFNVVAPYDLNQKSCLPIQDSETHGFVTCCCFNRGSLNFKVTIPNTGLVSGQTVEAKVWMKNLSNSVDVTKADMVLRNDMTFYTTRRSSSKKAYKEVAKAKVDGPFNMETEFLFQIKVPPLPPSDLEFCSLIELKYSLQLCLHVSGIHCNIDRRYPITIGNIPLQSASAPFFTTPTTTIAPSAPSEDTLVDVPGDSVGKRLPPFPVSNESSGMSYPHPIGFVSPDQEYSGVSRGLGPPDGDLRPPSYEDCIFGGTQRIRDEDESSDRFYGGNAPFVPKYPVYKFPVPDN